MQLHAMTSRSFLEPMWRSGVCDHLTSQKSKVQFFGVEVEFFSTLYRIRLKGKYKMWYAVNTNVNAERQSLMKSVHPRLSYKTQMPEETYSTRLRRVTPILTRRHTETFINANIR